MNDFEKRQQVMVELASDADRSNREIARKLRLSEGLVRAVRKSLEKSGTIQVTKRDKGGRRPKQLEGRLQEVKQLEEAEPIDIASSESDVPVTDQYTEEARQRLQQQVLDLVEKGKVSALALVKGMSAKQLEGVISGLEEPTPSQQDAPGTAKTQAKPILGFKGAYRWLSNFWPAPVMLDGMRYSDVEHAYQAAKTLDPEVRARIAALPKPGQAKRFGRRIQLRPDWDGGTPRIVRFQWLAAQWHSNLLSQASTRSTPQTSPR